MNDPSNTASKSNGVTSITKQTTNLLEILPDLQAGVFLSQIEQALTDAALNICVHGEKGKKAKVTVEFDLSRIGESNQVAVAHTVSFTYPTKRGKKSETATTETPMHVGQRGRLTLLPEAEQGGLPFGGSR